MEVENIDLIAKLEEYKNIISLHMADQFDSMITSNRENIRMKCLEAALKFYELRGLGCGCVGDCEKTAEEFYKFVKGE